jgi:hypothetical protein
MQITRDVRRTEVVLSHLIYTYGVSSREACQFIQPKRMDHETGHSRPLQHTIVSIVYFVRESSRRALHWLTLLLTLSRVTTPTTQTSTYCG